MKKTMLTKEDLQESWKKSEDVSQTISVKKSMLSKNIMKMMEFNEEYELIERKHVINLN